MPNILDRQTRSMGKHPNQTDQHSEPNLPGNGNPTRHLPPPHQLLQPVFLFVIIPQFVYMNNSLFYYKSIFATTPHRRHTPKKCNATMTRRDFFRFPAHSGQAGMF
ncbi:MAG: hypothetical protein HQL98_05975 [Magnetococcales bacterium]|nr:hypothetical protein [Magnetococcales bacterium]